MTDLGPNQLAWLRKYVSAFKPAEKQASDARRHSEEVERKLKARFDTGGSNLTGVSPTLEAASRVRVQDQSL